MDLKFNIEDYINATPKEMFLNYNGGIYMIYNIFSKSCYIGSTICFHTRMLTHLSRLKKNKKPSIKLQNDFNLYGKESFRFLIIEEVFDKIQLEERERYWINKTHPQYNHQLNIKRYVFSDERNKKISTTLKEKIKRGKDNPIYGIKRDREIIERIFKTRAINKDKIYKSMSKEVVIIEEDLVINKFKSLTDASRVLSIPRSTLGNIIKKEEYIKGTNKKVKYLNGQID